MNRTLVCVLLVAACGGTRPELDGFAEGPPALTEPPPSGFTPSECQRDPSKGAPVVYAHGVLASIDSNGNKSWSRNSIAVFDLDKLAITEWISLDACGDGGYVDMAVDGKGTIFMSGANGLYRMDPTTHECKTIKKAWQDENEQDIDRSYHHYPTPNNLTSAPANLFDPKAPRDREVLVGFGGTLKDDTDLKSWDAGFVRLDPETGKADILRPYVKDAPEWSLWPSGDLVSVIDTCKQTAVTWATVYGNKEKTLCRACEGTLKAGLDCGDCLYEFDMTTGKFGKNFGLLPYDGIFGLAFWGGTLVGFNYKGKVFTIDPSTSPLVTKEVPIQLPAGFVDVTFMGAGSTTLAPISAVR